MVYPVPGFISIRPGFYTSAVMMMMVGGANGAAFVSITYRILLGIRIAGIVMSSWEGGWIATAAVRGRVPVKM